MRVSFQSNCLRMQHSLSIHLPVTSARRGNKERKKRGWTGPLLGKGGSTYEFMNSWHGVRKALLTFGSVKYLPNSYSRGHKRDDNYANDWRRPTPTRQLHFHNDALTYRAPKGGGEENTSFSLSSVAPSSGLRLLMTRLHRLKAHFLAFKKTLTFASGIEGFTHFYFIFLILWIVSVLIRNRVKLILIWDCLNNRGSIMYVVTGDLQMRFDAEVWCGWI